jgi:hypothetical protein
VWLSRLAGPRTLLTSTSVCRLPSRRAGEQCKAGNLGPSQIRFGFNLLQVCSGLARNQSTVALRPNKNNSTTVPLAPNGTTFTKWLPPTDLLSSAITTPHAEAAACNQASASHLPAQLAHACCCCWQARLCCGQCRLWQSAPQYLSALQPLHSLWLRPAAGRELQLAHAASSAAPPPLSSPRATAALAVVPLQSVAPAAAGAPAVDQQARLASRSAARRSTVAWLLLLSSSCSAGTAPGWAAMATCTLLLPSARLARTSVTLTRAPSSLLFSSATS